MRKLTIGLLLTVSMAAFESLAVATTMPVTIADIGGLAYYGWTFSSFMLAEIVGISVAGRAADTRGLARPFGGGIALFSLGLLGAGLAPSMPILIAGRVLQGLGAGAISALSYVAIARGYAPEEQPRMLAMLSTAWVAPGLVGPALAGAIADHVGWRWVFLGLAPMMVVGGALTLPALRRFGLPADAGEPPESQTGAATGLAIAAALALLAVSLHSLPQTIVLLGAAAALGIPSLVRLVPEGTLVARRGLPAAIAVMALLSAAFFGVEVLVPLALTEIRRQPAALAGLAFTASTLTWTLGAWLQARLAPRHSRRLMVDVGLVVMGAGIIGTAAVLLPEVPPWVAAATWGVTGLGIGVAYSTTALVVLESAPAGKEGEASAAMQLANVLGAAIGTGLSGAVLARFTAAGQTAVVAIGVADAIAVLTTLVGVAAGLRLPGRPSPG